MTKKEIAYENIRNDIFCRNLLPGTKLVISALAERYNMSGIPIREALTMLENDKLVTNIPYAGFVVSRVNFDDFIEYSLIRNQMECLALRIGITYLTDESMAVIMAHQEKLRELYQAGEFEQYVIANRKFYESLYSFAPCENLKSMIQSLNRKSFHSQSILLMVPSRLEKSMAEHEALIAAIRACNAEGAAEIMFVHRLNSMLSLIREIKYNLMKPNYIDQHILQVYFSTEELSERNALIGKIERWAYILENVSIGYSHSSIDPVHMSDRFVPLGETQPE